jgi:predicted CXXCH cytochrome family protein
MTSIYSFRTVQIVLLLSLVLYFFSANVYSFTSGEEYVSHLKNEPTCITGKCHENFLKGRQFSHNPASGGLCSDCHKAESYPDRYGVRQDQSITCAKCHTSLEKEIQSSLSVHGPVKNGDCTSCHDPHESERQFLLRESYSSLCSSCHNLNRLYAGEFVHKPVKDGNCGLCHDPHASKFKSRLTDTGANLCVICHDDMVAGMSAEYVHMPLLESGCTDCHDPHSGGNRLRFKASADQICFNCHEEKKNEMSQYMYRHEPAEKGMCISCHSPHFSENRYLLLDKIDALCFACHKKNSIWKKKRFQHGPVVQGNCSACHNPHGSDHAFILRLSFPHTFYSSYEKGEYDLCFNCHKESLVTTDKTSTITNFRNGTNNLHSLHVKQKKGRTCRACHNVHASDQYDHIREEFHFGNSLIPVQYFKTATGGRCIPGCHRERGYDRVNIVDNVREP